MIYDCLVERRQALVLSAARRSNQIVNSLFPENVRDRLLVTNNNHNTRQRTTGPDHPPQSGGVQVVTELVTGVPKAMFNAARNPSALIPDLRTIPTRLANAAPFMGGGGGTGSPPSQGRRSSREWQDANQLWSTPSSGKPIADFFPETSVMFGDIVGFTAWSSVREPFQASSRFLVLSCLARFVATEPF